MNGRISRITGIFVTLLLCLAFTAAHAEPVSFQWLSVPQGTRDVEAVRAIGPDQWQTVPAGQTLNQGFSDDEFWLQVPVPAQPANRVLEVGYPLLDEVSVYWELDGRVVESHHTGDTRPFDSRPIVHRNFVFLVPSNTEPVTAWIRVQTQGSVQVPVAVTPSAEFLANEQISYGWQTMFLGIVVALALYNLFLFLIVRHQTYLWYVLAVIFSGAVQLNFNGLLFQWFWPDLPWTPLLLGHLVLAVSKLGWIPRSPFTELAPQAGVAVEVILLSFALAYRINMERRRRQQAQEHALDVQRQANLTLESRVRERTGELEQAYERLRAISLTINLGVATLTPNRQSDCQELIRRADEALYAAKAEGRNRVVIWHPKAVAPTTG